MTESPAGPLMLPIGGWNTGRASLDMGPSNACEKDRHSTGLKKYESWALLKLRESSCERLHAFNLLASTLPTDRPSIVSYTS